MCKINSLLLVCLLFFVSCKKDPSLWKIENLNENTISVFGHGGMGINYRYPMNSKTSLMDCLSSGADGAEMDVHVSKDSVMVLYHNQTLEELTRCSGKIKEKNWSDVNTCEYQLPFLNSETIVSADVFFEAIPNPKNFKYVFDCKVMLEDEVEYVNLFARTLIAHITKYDLIDLCFIESSNATFLEILKAKNPALHVCLYTNDFLSGLELAKKLNLYGMTMDSDKITAENVKQAHQANIHIALFNLNTEQKNLKAIEKSPDYLQTDKVEYLVNALKE
jgi:glycerophosphoryl diester phosphodiesterase